ncbi:MULTISPECIES: restriction endonuclease subunit S [Klebsiella]|nr:MULTISPECIES: restriction endonuclease subunit S [Klebsiella]MBD7651962.1 restriction endonuclease subunit S [Klebsiella pneumoniae]RRF55256.1 restriction endonuclease subunit S [Klebsiella pneumoniae]VUT04399.1 hypothetical protein SB6423_04047 [Klebsiella pasteurii]HBS7611433.1 restriction endonuclease subunit S [Klebsiella pneumoniae]HBV9412689.1 hypothetical protein [Klebsiella pneumoniae]
MVPKLRFNGFAIPWKKAQIGSILTIGSGRDYKHLAHGEVPVFGSGGLMTYVDEFLHDGETVCIGRKGTIDKPFYYSGKIWTVDTLFFTHSFIKVLPKFIFNVFCNINWKEHNEASGVPSLSKSTIGKIEVFYPDLKEQYKIANFLASVDEKISSLNKQYNLLCQYKKGMMQRIFSQELRFKDREGKYFPKWESKKIGAFISEYKCKTTKEDEWPVMTSSRSGLVLQSDYYGENRLTERSNIGFNIIPQGYLTYRSRSDDGLFFFNQNRLNTTGCISVYYPVFKFKYGSNYFYTTMFNYYKNSFRAYAVGSSQLVLSITDLKVMKFMIPDPDEQMKISEFLSSIDKRIDKTKSTIDKLKTWKQGLLQQMFV